jgi:hypothetical protein
MLVQHEGEGFEPRPILDRRREPLRGRRLLGGRTTTASPPEAVFGDFDGGLRQLKHLARLVALGVHRRLAGLTNRREAVVDDVIGVLDLRSAMPWVSLDSPNWTFAGLTKAARLLAQAIARRGLRGVVAVFGLLSAPFLDLSLQRCVLRLQGGHVLTQGDERIKERVNKVVFLGVRESAEIGELFHQRSIGSPAHFLNPK